MRLDGALGGAKLESDLLVNPATDHPFENLPLPWRQFGNERTLRLEPQMLLPDDAMTRHGTLDGVDQFVLRHRLGEEVFGAGLDRLDGHRNVAMTCYEDDRQCRSELDQAALQFRAAETGDLHVEQDATRAAVIRQLLQQRMSRFINHDLVAQGTQ